MGFFDKIKNFFKTIKEENKYFARTTARINSGKLYGWVNYRPGKIDPNEDFRNLSYVNVENGKGLIYNTGDEDYIFEPGDIVTFKLIGDGQPVNGGKDSSGNQLEDGAYVLVVTAVDAAGATVEVQKTVFGKVTGVAYDGETVAVGMGEVAVDMNSILAVHSKDTLSATGNASTQGETQTV